MPSIHPRNTIPNIRVTPTKLFTNIHDILQKHCPQVFLRTNCVYSNTETHHGYVVQTHSKKNHIKVVHEQL